MTLRRPRKRSDRRFIVALSQEVLGSCEGFVERVRRHGGHVEVTVLLADGRGATARLALADWEWLDVRTGDIVPVRHLAVPVSG